MYDVHLLLLLVHTHTCAQISENDRELIKKIIVGLMLKTPESLQRQLSDAITIIGMLRCACSASSRLRLHLQYTNSKRCAL